MKKIVLVFCFVSWSQISWSFLVESSQFEVGKEWTWAYSEKNKNVWQQPYLFETYKVFEKQGDEVTILMASRASLKEDFKPHHKFTININECLRSGKNLSRFLKLKISFYSKTGSESWTLLSHNHKALAFTEKFNCYWGQLPKEEKWINSSQQLIFQWRGSPIRSWYLDSRDQSNGVAYQRRAGNYKMELLSE